MCGGYYIGYFACGVIKNKIQGELTPWIFVLQLDFDFTGYSLCEAIFRTY